MEERSLRVQAQAWSVPNLSAKVKTLREEEDGKSELQPHANLDLPARDGKVVHRDRYAIEGG